MKRLRGFGGGHSRQNYIDKPLQFSYRLVPSSRPRCWMSQFFDKRRQSLFFSLRFRRRILYHLKFTRPVIFLLPLLNIVQILLYLFCYILKIYLHSRSLWVLTKSLLKNQILKRLNLNLRETTAQLPLLLYDLVRQIFLWPHDFMKLVSFLFIIPLLIFENPILCGGVNAIFFLKTLGLVSLLLKLIP